MSARLILHITLTLILFAVGWWLYMSIGNAGALDSVNVAKYWFAMQVYVFFSWVFYWVAHRFKLRVWLLMQVLAVLISAISTGALLYVSREYQKQVEEEALQDQKDEAALSSDVEQETKHETTTIIDLESDGEVLNLSEGGELNDSAVLEPGQSNSNE